MNKKDIEKLEEITREIIENLEEETPDDSSGLLCAQNHKSPFRQLIGLLEMEMASIKIMYSDEPLPDPEFEKFSAQEIVKSEQPARSPANHASETFDEKKVHKPANGKPRELITIDEKPGTTTQGHDKKQTHLQSVATVIKVKTRHEEPQVTELPKTKILLAGGSLLLLMLIGYILLKQGSQAAPPAKIVVNWSDIEQGKTHISHFQANVDPKKKKSAKSFYAMGKKELDNNNLKAAREYFRSAVSLDPSTQEYMDAFRQTDYTIRKKKEQKQP